ncbi:MULTISPECIES: CoA transferase [unclassified Bradyrhizobium]|uniref:CaiB/BaiF CoA transferase family protein n=1 Tax=unclassified Bradyrhizobium TaxID=2631580 RepID=UPI001FF86BF2|nr:MULTISPECIES: CoA transferase [unclassified Bradyrhizobium]MCK1420258.1 CoA transferase [Bradyrhizobium sp. CW12]MCK1646568.1 CoA transferase [Bradyrhizobium sp. 154]
MSLPLTGIRVLDLSNVLAGPFCGYHLARLGAEVIKVENPNGGDLARRLGADPQRAERLQGLSFVAVNAGKQSVALDLKSESGREVFLRLVKEADVVLENFRPKVMERLSLGFDVLSRQNPRLVYCAISGFGQSGPWSARPAYDQIVQGLSGAMSVTGDMASAPLRTGFPISDTIAGLTAAFAIAAALVDQRHSGRGRFIDVSLLEATVAAMGWVVSNHLNAGVEPQPIGNENFTAAPSGTFRTATGPLNISANEQKQYQALCDLIGRPDLKTDPRFAGREMRKVNRAALNTELNKALGCKPADEWEAQMNLAGVPAGCVLTVSQVLQQPQLLERGFVETLAPEQDGAQPLRITRPGFRLDEEFSVPSPPATLGADTERWLQRLGYSNAEVEQLVSSRAVGTPKQGGADFLPVRVAADGPIS